MKPADYLVTAGLALALSSAVPALAQCVTHARHNH